VGPDQTQRILRRALDGDEAALEGLLGRIRPRLVLWIAARLSPDLRTRVDPEDLAQEVLLAVHRGLGGFEDRGSRTFFGWLFRLAENRIRDAADYFDAAKRQPAERARRTQTSPSGALVRAERLARVRDAVATLPEDYRRVIQLRRLEEREVAEVARILDRSENAVRILYCRALAALESELKRSGPASAWIDG
jgi:RNA polymerase sigma-70 factor (ECF subfamily)